MIRRPRYPLTLRLAWIESEIGNAARLLPSMIDDLKELQRSVYGADARIVIVAHLAVTALMPFGADPRKGEALLLELGPEGDLKRADFLAGELLAEVLLGLSDTDGEAD